MLEIGQSGVAKIVPSWSRRIFNPDPRKEEAAKKSARTWTKESSS